MRYEVTIHVPQSEDITEFHADNLAGNVMGRNLALKFEGAPLNWRGLRLDGEVVAASVSRRDRTFRLVVNC